jgi:uncharacterized UBP type Zn finger protein
MPAPCEDLDGLTAESFTAPESEDTCPECLREGTTWVALRACKTCGHVGCCDSSPRLHATKHFQSSRHPVMRSITPGNRWTWCYIHEKYGELA